MGPTIARFFAGAIALAALALGPGSRAARADPASPTAVAPDVKAHAIFPEGTFEDVDERGNPTGWILTDHRHMSVVKENGNNFLRLTNFDAANTVILESHFRLSPAWKSVKIAARLRSTDLKVGSHAWECARLGFVFERAPGERVGDYPDTPKLRRSADWTVKEAIVPVPEGARYINLQPILQNATGTFDLDDIQIIGNPPLTTKVLRPGFPEGSFEHLDANGNPQGWDFDDPHIRIVEENGNHFLRLTNDNPQWSVFVDNYFKIDPAWHALMVTARLRGKDIKTGPEGYSNARFGYAFADARGQRVGDWPQTPSLRHDTTGWLEFHLRVAVPPGAAYIKLTPILHNTTGTLDIDDIKFEPAE